MNRHQQEVKKYLSQAFGLNQRIESKLGQIDKLHDLASKASVTCQRVLIHLEVRCKIVFVRL